MIAYSSSPQIVNPPVDSWPAELYGELGVTYDAQVNPAFNQQGPTLDLVFAGYPSSELTDGPSLDLSLTEQIYQIGQQYTIWE